MVEDLYEADVVRPTVCSTLKEMLEKVRDTESELATATAALSLKADEVASQQAAGAQQLQQWQVSQLKCFHICFMRSQYVH